MTSAAPTLSAFLLERIEELAEAARAADVKQSDPEWWVSPVAASLGEHFTVRSRLDNRPIARVQRLDGDEDEPAGILDGRAVAEHIARWDPQRVLAECESKRRIVELHEPMVELRPTKSGDYTEYHVCSECSDLDEVLFPCTTVRLLAQPYADHKDFQPEWRLT